MKKLGILILPFFFSVPLMAKTLNQAVHVAVNCNVTYQEGVGPERNVPLSVSRSMGDGLSVTETRIPFGLSVNTRRSGPQNYFEHFTSGTSCTAEVPDVGRFNFYAGIVNEFRNEPHPSIPEDYVHDSLSASLVNQDGSLLSLDIDNPELNQTYSKHVYIRSTVRTTDGLVIDRVQKVTLTCRLDDRAGLEYNESYPNVQQNDDSGSNPLQMIPGTSTL